MSRTIEEIIAMNHEIPIEIVRQQRKISPYQAIEIYLSEQSRTEIESAGFKLGSTKSVQQKLINAFKLDDYLAKFKDEFCKTPEGKLWYQCNIPTKEESGEDYLRICDETYRSAQEYAKSVAEGTRRTIVALGISPARRKG